MANKTDIEIRQESPQDDTLGQLPNFVIVGAMKSGTTSLARYLGEHPEVFMTPKKEIHFFDRHYDEGVSWYKNRFDGVKSERAVGEATPVYMYSEEVVSRMAETVPNAKLIAILRNPVDRAYSHYWHQRARGREDLDFEDALAAEDERLASGDEFHLAYHGYIQRSSYSSQIGLLCKYFPKDSLQVVISEELHGNPVEVFQSVCRFLSVDDNFIPPNLGVEFNRYVGFRSEKLRGIIWNLGNYPWMIPGVRGILGRLNTYRTTYPDMDEKLRNKLVKRFKSENEFLESWLGRDLSVWNE